MSRKRAPFGLLFAVVIATGVIFASGIAGADPGEHGNPGPDKTATPIKHVVVIFQENVSFDHYFGTYPNASGGDGQPFSARPGTPAVDGLTPATDVSIPAALRHSSDLTTATANPNLSPPLRLDSSPNGLVGDAGGLETCDQDHNYSDEQQAFDAGAMDQFVQSVGTDGGSHTPNGAALCQPATVMDYFDGNSTTALWNYAQHFSMSDNSFGTTFGPSAPGAINLASGNTGVVDTAHEANSPSVASITSPPGVNINADLTPDGLGGFSLTSDAQPYWDDCSTRDAVALSGSNIGDELNKAGLSWGWFQGGFRPTPTFAAAANAPGHTNQSTSLFIPDEFSGSFTGKVTPPVSTTGLASGLGTTSNQALCDAYHPIGLALGASGTSAATAPWGFKDDYIAHHEPFQYYASTANPHHLTIATDGSGNDLLHGADSLSNVGTDTQAFAGTYGTNPQFNTPNHNYDSSDFDQLVAAINNGSLPASALPAVTFLKAPGYQDGHAQYSNPEDEQVFIANEVNALMKSPDWSSTVVFVNYDDSDGWYDHVYSGVTNPSSTIADNLTGTVKGKITTTNTPSGKCGSSGTPLAGEQGRCGFGPRLPMLAISPCAASNTIDHNLSDQASIINFIEYNWNLPAIPGSFDQALKSTDAAEGVPFDLAGMFDFSNCNQPALPLDPATGQTDLAGANLRNSNQQGADYANGNLSNSNLDGSNLQGGFLPGANLTGSSLREIDAEGSDMAGDNLTNATLQDAKLQGSNLSGSNLTNTNLRHAQLAGANVHGVTWSNTTCPDGTNSSQDGGTCVGHLQTGH